jgi:hypothetical protein
MQKKRLALFFLALIFILTLVPAYYPPDDEALQQNSSLCDIYSQLFTATGTFCDFSHTPGWTGVSLSLDIFYYFSQYIPSSTATRAPPA